MATGTDEALDAAFRAGLDRAGIAVPAGRHAVMRDAYAGYRDLARVLEEPLPRAAEPAAAYRAAAGTARARGA